MSEGLDSTPLEKESMQDMEAQYTHKDAPMSRLEAQLLHDADKAATKLQLSGLSKAFIQADAIRLLIKGFIHYRAKASAAYRATEENK